ncbi:HAMP domain-containing sensor histidine kinase [Tateyamaria sp. syn59]|uniref:sensor histidine kinase n=1 Tax=Tateyamaria sp. syn59 TaxID=2576942 RepID=UPI0011BEEE25|nr:HAMP domain-containing sensor histidine kinase [Tateyamaria sp. syn59]
MRVTTKIAIAQTALILTAGAVVTVMLMTLRSNQTVMQEIINSYEQSLTVKTIAQMADNYSEQIAEHVILGPESEEAAAAHDVLMETISAMERKILGEFQDLTRSGNQQEAAYVQLELDRMKGLREAVTRLEDARSRMVSSLYQDNTARAVAIYAEEIEDGFDVALDQLTEESVVREQVQVRDALLDSQVAAARIRWIVVFLALSAVSGALVLSAFLHKSILQPIARLDAAVRAVSAGNLEARIGDNRRDELGDVGRGFDNMTAKVSAQRGALVAARDSLERQVAERTEALTTALQDLELQSEQRSRFLADISHELRTPLTVLRGRAEVALADPGSDADTMRTVLERIVRTSNHLGRLVDDLLFLARSEAGVISIEKGPVVLQDVLADILLDCRQLARGKGITLMPSQPDALLTIEGDADRLRQAVLIALDNAVAAAPSGSTVWVTLMRAGNHAVLEVADEGPGFSDSEIAEPARRFRKGQGRGNGLGLSIADWIMAGHDGHLRLSNAKDGGAVVRLELPLSKS